MTAIILAAGVGKRMQPLTHKTHKTLLSVGGETVIKRIINGLILNGIKHIIVVTGYKADLLRAFLDQEFPHVSIQYVHNEPFLETNNIYSLWLALQQTPANEDILLIESDLIYDSEVLNRIIRSPHSNVALVDKFRSGMDGTVVVLNGQVITNIIPPHLQGPNFDFSDKYKTLNIYKFSSAFVDGTFRNLVDYYVKIFDRNSYYELVLGILIYVQKENIYGEVVAGERWAEIDDPNDLSVAEFKFSPDKRYELLERSFGGYWNYDFLDFAYIRNIHFPDEAMMAEMRANMPALLSSYCSSQVILNKKMAYFLCCDPQRVSVLNGASQVYPWLVEYFAGRKFLLPQPTFGEYAHRFPQQSIYVDSPGFTLDDVEKGLSQSDVVVIVNPNNPTGTVCSTDRIYELAAVHPNKFFLIDESFIDFSNERSIIGMLEERPLGNVAVIKSLSKAWGVPGLRIGFLYSANAQLNVFVANRIPIWNMNSVAEFFLELILKFRISLTGSFEKTRTDRASLQGDLKQLSFVDDVFESGGNFLLARLKPFAAPRDFCREMLERYSIYLKDVSSKFHDGRTYIRFAVRSASEHKDLIRALREFM